MRPTSPSTQLVDVEIVLPVYNEQRVLEGSVRRLDAFLCHGFPFSWRITIADNGSTDRTAAVARRLSYELPGVEAIRIPAKGRGRALREAWSAGQARVLCYMDVDLSTDLGRCSRWSLRCSPATATWRSARDCIATPGSRVDSSAS